MKTKTPRARRLIFFDLCSLCLSASSRLVRFFSPHLERSVRTKEYQSERLRRTDARDAPLQAHTYPDSPGNGRALSNAASPGSRFSDTFARKVLLQAVLGATDFRRSRSSSPRSGATMAIAV